MNSYAVSSIFLSPLGRQLLKFLLAGSFWPSAMISRPLESAQSVPRSRVSLRRERRRVCRLGFPRRGAHFPGLRARGTEKEALRGGLEGPGTRVTTDGAPVPSAARTRCGKCLDTPGEGDGTHEPCGLEMAPGTKAEAPLLGGGGRALTRSPG